MVEDTEVATTMKATGEDITEEASTAVDTKDTSRLLDITTVKR